MVARLAIMSAGLPVDLGLALRIHKQWGATYEYNVERDDVFVLALELAGETITPYARIPVLPNGNPPLKKEIENRQRFRRSFRFEIGETFCVIEILEDTFWISKVNVARRGRRYLMTCRYIAERLPVSLAYGESVPSHLKPFVPAIKLGMEDFWVLDTRMRQ